ncbi:hypothetical protein OQA88_12756 [Cercophora sp. LCS_1]
MEQQPGLRPTPAVGGADLLLIVATICVFVLPILIYFPPMLPSKSEALLQTHTPIGLPPAKSGLRRRNTKPAPPRHGHGTEGPAKIRSLWIYPVKSCKGIEVSESKVVPSGLEFDRLYTFAQLKSPFPVGINASETEKGRHKWDFITQRQFPLLATVNVDLFLPDLAKTKGHDAADSDGYLVLRFPWVESGLLGVLGWVVAKLGRGWRALPEKEVVLPVAFPSPGEIDRSGYVYEEVTIWREAVTALNLEAELPRELRLYLGYPLHLLSLSSVRDFDAKINKDNILRELDPRRFRANIIVDGVAPYGEETWKEIRFDADHARKRESSRFHVSCRTVRCKMPNVDQDSGARHPVEPDRSLRKFRDVDEGAKNKGCLGMQLTPLFDQTDVPEAMETWVALGMSVEVLKKGEHRYINQ